MIAYHGGAAVFDRFDAAFIKTGQGVLTYGWGIYLSASRDVACGYRDLYGARTVYRVDGREVAIAGLHDPMSKAVWSIARLGKEGARRYLAQLQETEMINREWVDDFERHLLQLGERRVECEDVCDGALYEVRIPDGQAYLEWDLPMADQPEAVKRALGVSVASLTFDEMRPKSPWVDRQWMASNGWSVVLDGRRYRVYDPSGGFLGDKVSFEAAVSHIQRLSGDNTGGCGRVFYKDLVDRLGGQRQASEHLASLGIKGIRYVDGHSTGAGQGESNYVVFDVADVEIISVNDKAVLRPTVSSDRGMFDRASGSIAYLPGADASTIIHESAHLFFEHDLALARLVLARATSAEEAFKHSPFLADVSTLLSWCGIEGGIAQQLEQWDGLSLAEQGVLHDDVADAFEIHCMRGACPHPKLKGIFSRLARWMTDVYSGVASFIARRPRSADVGAAVSAVLDRMVVASDDFELGPAGQRLYARFLSQAIETRRFSDEQCEAQAMILASHYVSRARLCQMDVDDCFAVTPASLHAQALFVAEAASQPVPSDSRMQSESKCDEIVAQSAVLTEPSRFLALPQVAVARDALDARQELDGLDGVPSEYCLIDGFKRATCNDRGLPIAKDMHSLVSFWRWFGDCGLVDEQGRPRVFFSGRRRVSAPDKFVQTNGRATPSFTADPYVASVYARQVDGLGMQYGPGSNVMPVYLGSKSVLDLRELGAEFTLEDFVMILPGVDLECDYVSTGVGYLDLAGALAGLDGLSEKTKAHFEIKAVDSDGYPLEDFAEVRQRLIELAQDGDIEGVMDLLGAVKVDSFLLADSAAMTKLLTRLGFDAVAHRDAFVVGQRYYEGSSELDVAHGGVASVETFRPFFQAHIKSAVGNCGAFQAGNPNILMQSAVCERWPRYVG